MNLQEFLDKVIDAGIEAARRDYNRPDQLHKLEGSIEGFEACRDKTPLGLLLLLKQVGEDRNKYMRNTFGRDEKEEEIKKYWRLRCKELEVEWTCNCVSAILINQGLPPIITPTVRGTIQADKILKEATRHEMS